MGSEWQQARDVRLTREREWARWALHRWADFPVDADPRPIVLAGPAAWPEAGFRSGAAKIAFLRGVIASDQPVPEGLTEVMGSRVTGGPLTTEPLIITGVEYASTEFVTDRGRRVLPAYRLTGPEFDGAVWVLDPAVVPRTWAPQGDPEPPPGEGSPHRSMTGRVMNAQGTRLLVQFTGGPPEWVHYDSAEVIDSRSAVVILPIARDTGPSGPRTAVGYRREAEIELDAPLGSRVVVDLDTTPVAIEIKTEHE